MTTSTSNVAKVGPDCDLECQSHATQVEELAWFVCRSHWDEISGPAREQLKLRVLDSLGVALGAVDGEPFAMVREQVQEFGGAPLCTLIGRGKSAPDRAALYNGALVRYVDFNDFYLAPGETCTPSDNLAPVLAAAEYAARRRSHAADRSGGRLPGPEPPLRGRAGACQGFRPHNAGRLRRLGLGFLRGGSRAL